ncbi:hypothetical protein HYT57_02985 [Candidatus Woesearchaeota archaeon]|nr:hypothetical protein [Candidatus Woesearchaeota archaeon]
MSIRDYIKRKFEEGERIDREYHDLYLRCFEGNNDEVLMKLEAWDWVHRTTRYGR